MMFNPIRIFKTKPGFDYRDLRDFAWGCVLAALALGFAFGYWIH